jgi:hypothetical protein
MALAPQRRSVMECGQACMHARQTRGAQPAVHQALTKHKHVQLCQYLGYRAQVGWKPLPTAWDTTINDDLDSLDALLDPHRPASPGACGSDAEPDTVGRVLVGVLVAINRQPAASPAAALRQVR